MSRKDMVLQLLLEILATNQIAEFFDDQYQWKE